MKSLFIVFLVMLTGSTQAFELSSDARAWIEPIHPVTKDLKQAGISFCKLSYNLPINSLHISRTKVRDVTFLRTIPISELFFYPFSVTNGMDTLRRSKTLKKTNRTSSEAFWLGYDTTLLKLKEQAEQHVQQALPETMPSTFPGEPLR